MPAREVGIKSSFVKKLTGRHFSQDQRDVAGKSLEILANRLKSFFREKIDGMLIFTGTTGSCQKGVQRSAAE
ncbi:MAG: hypothetical protein CVU54_14680 [Deltaproteobacteria bacterium HGW-Deltaproteobacteria-12]|nr:MAG: hypothetical protein CVU54_14680 [Deltaproteobacteria bacterium HGW-Deltaproteobacteria-12]